MAKRFSVALRSYLANKGCINDALDNGIIVLFNGSQPATADAAFNTGNGTALVAITQASGAVDKMVDPSFLITCTSPNNTTLHNLKIGGFDIIGGDVSDGDDTNEVWRNNLLAAINSFDNKMLKVTAVAVESPTPASIRITLPKNTGAQANDMIIPVFAFRSGTSGCGLSVNGNALFTGAETYVEYVDTAIIDSADSTNCVPGIDGIDLLKMGSASGATEKTSTVWSGVGGSANINLALDVFNAAFTGFASGENTATWFRYYASMDDPELTGTATADDNGLYMRYDGTIGNSSAYDMVSTGGTVVVYGATQTIPVFTFSVPAQQ